MALTKAHNRMIAGSYVNVLDYGAVGNGTTDDTAAIQAAFTAAGIRSVVYFPPLTYSISSTITIPDPQDVTVMAHGAAFKLTADTLMFDLNGRADPTYTNNESRQNFNWYGGRFFCTITTPTKACAMRALGFRHATLEPEDFGIGGGGFYNDIITGGKDTVRIRDYKTFDCEDASILFPPWSDIGGPLMFVIDGIHGSLGNDAALVKSYMPLTDCVLRDFSCNMGTGATQTAIDVQKSVCLGLSSRSGDFTVGETVTGGTSGATGIYVELYTHQFPFQISSHLQWLVLSDRNANLFVAGETLTGGTSGSTAVVGNNTGYVSQNYSFQNLNIEGSNHFESGSGANGATCIRIADIEKRGNASVNFNISGCSLGVNGGGAYGIRLENITRLKINNVRFAQTSGNGVPIQFDADCIQMTIGRAAFFSSGAIDLNGMSRDELEMSEFDVLFDRVKVLTGWNPKALSTVGDTLIDMSADFNQFATVGGLPPRAYGMTITARDSGSAATANARFRIHNPSDTSTNLFSLIGLGGVTDSALRSGFFVVGADANGDLEYDAIASGAGTLDVFLTVTEMKY